MGPNAGFPSTVQDNTIRIARGLDRARSACRSRGVRLTDQRFRVLAIPLSGAGAIGGKGFRPAHSIVAFRGLCTACPEGARA